MNRKRLIEFYVLGQEVTKLINANLAAGGHEYKFNVSSLSCGVYFYRIDATGVDFQLKDDLNQVVK